MSKTCNKIMTYLTRTMEVTALIRSQASELEGLLYELQLMITQIDENYSAPTSEENSFTLENQSTKN